MAGSVSESSYSGECSDSSSTSASSRSSHASANDTEKNENKKKKNDQKSILSHVKAEKQTNEVIVDEKCSASSKNTVTEKNVSLGEEVEKSSAIVEQEAATDTEESSASAADSHTKPEYVGVSGAADESSTSTQLDPNKEKALKSTQDGVTNTSTVQENKELQSAERNFIKEVLTGRKTRRVSPSSNQYNTRIPNAPNLNGPSGQNMGSFVGMNGVMPFANNGPPFGQGNFNGPNFRGMGGPNGPMNNGPMNGPMGPMPMIGNGPSMNNNGPSSRGNNNRNNWTSNGMGNNNGPWRPAGPGQNRGSNNNNNSNNGICKAFMRGHCRLGKSCKYIHPIKNTSKRI